MAHEGVGGRGWENDTIDYLLPDFGTDQVIIKI
jgi:hypothetical protein